MHRVPIFVVPDAISVKWIETGNDEQFVCEINRRGSTTHTIVSFLGLASWSNEILPKSWLHYDYHWLHIVSSVFNSDVLCLPLLVYAGDSV